MPRLPRPSPAALAGLAVVALTLAVYAGTLSAGFVRWDDDITIYENNNLGDLGLDEVAWSFTDVATTMRFVPLTLLSLSLTHTLHGLDPFGYHLANWLLHAAAALLLFLLLLELFRRATRRRGADPDAPWVVLAAAVGALAWSLHPLRVEVEAWANSRGHAQATLLAVTSLLVYVRAHREEAPTRHPGRAAALSAAAFLAALLSHPIAIGVAPVFLLLDVHLGRLGGRAGWWSPATRRVLLEKVPFIAAAAAVVAVTVFVRTFFSGRWDPPVPLAEWGLFPRAMQATYVWIHYVLVTLWPVGLQPAPTDLISFDPWDGVFLVRAALVASVTAALLLLGRRWPLALVSWLAWLCLLVPALGLTEHPMFACDRYANLPDLVPAALLGAGVLWLGGSTARRVAAGVAAAVLLAVLGTLTRAQVATWRDSITLFEHMLPLLGDHPFRQQIYATLGASHLDVKDPAGAVGPFEQAVTLSPYDPMLRSYLGYCLWASGRPAEAVEQLEAGVALASRDAGLRCQLAAALVQAGRPEAAVEQARLALTFGPGAGCAERILIQLGATRRP